MSAVLSVAVVSFNTRDLTLRCLKAVEAAGGGDRVCALVDNGSTDGTVEAVGREYPAWHVMVQPENPGYGASINRVFSAFPASDLCALNADVMLGSGSLSILRRFLAEHPECGLVGPALRHPDGRPQPSCKRFPTLGFAIAELLSLHALLPRSRWVRRFYYADRDLPAPAWVEAIPGAAMLIRGAAFQRVGGFDEGFRMYFEETDLCWRLRRDGYRVAVCPQATAVHWHGASTLQSSVRQVEYYLSYVRFFRKHHGLVSTRILSAAVAVSTVARMLALPLKYPPLSRRGLAILRPKLAACWRLLGQLRRPGTARRPTEALP